jgi:hypothetical protein
VTANEGDDNKAGPDSSPRFLFSKQGPIKKGTYWISKLRNEKENAKDGTNSK